MPPARSQASARADVIPDRIGLQGWSNGGSTVLATMSPVVAGVPADGFRAALAFYPGCGLHGAFDEKPLRPTAPILLLHGTADEEVSYKRCQQLVERSRAAGGRIDIKLYAGATHGFDSPARSVQKRDANAVATDDAVAQAGLSAAKAIDLCRHRRDGFRVRSTHPTKAHCASVLGAKISSSFIRRGVRPCSSE